MSKSLFTILIIGGIFSGPSKPEEAKAHFDKMEYAEAVERYTEALDEYPEQKFALRYNIGQSNLRRDSVQKALLNFNGVTGGEDVHSKLASLANNNVGCIFFEAAKQKEKQAQQQMMPPGAPGNPGGTSPQPGSPANQAQDEKEPTPMELLQSSIETFKRSLKKDHDNEQARYNYELAMRKLKKLQEQQQQQQDQQDQDKNQDKQDQDKKEQEKQDQNKEEQDKDQDKQDQQKQNQPKEDENKENKGQNQQKPGDAEEQEMNVEQAKALLEAMDENEKQFLQQLEKRKRHRKHHQNGPDW